MTNMKKLRDEIFNILLENAEDRDTLDTVDKTGSFETFRAEYLIDNIVDLFKQWALEMVGEDEKSYDSNGETKLQRDSLVQRNNLRREIRERVNK